MAQSTLLTTAPLAFAAKQYVVLSADDDPEARDALGELLIDLGFSPIVAKSGREALEFLRRGAKPALLFIDLHMPSMTGEALCRELDATPGLGEIPRVLVSGNPAWKE